MGERVREFFINNLYFFMQDTGIVQSLSKLLFSSETLASGAKINFHQEFRIVPFDPWLHFGVEHQLCSFIFTYDFNLLETSQIILQLKFRYEDPILQVQDLLIKTHFVNSGDMNNENRHWIFISKSIAQAYGLSLGTRVQIETIKNDMTFKGKTQISVSPLKGKICQPCCLMENTLFKVFDDQEINVTEGNFHGSLECTPDHAGSRFNNLQKSTIPYSLVEELQIEFRKSRNAGNLISKSKFSLQQKFYIYHNSVSNAVST